MSVESKSRRVVSAFVQAITWLAYAVVMWQIGTYVQGQYFTYYMAWMFALITFVIVIIGIIIGAQIFIGKMERSTEWRSRRALSWMIFACLPLGVFVLSEGLDIGLLWGLVIIVAAAILVQVIDHWIVSAALVAPAAIAATTDFGIGHQIGYTLVASVFGLHAIASIVMSYLSREPPVDGTGPVGSSS